MDSLTLSKLVGTIDNIDNVLLEYESFIKAFFLTDNPPPSVAYLPEMIRQGVVLSDTDSTCVSCDDWVKWYTNSDILIFNDITRGLANSVMYIATEALAHTLALFSSNINVEKSKLRALTMKSEFYWDVFLSCNITKHYFAWTRSKEGIIYSDPELEMKGVHLKSSNTPPRIRKHAKELMTHIVKTISNNEQLSLKYYINQITSVEKKIHDSLMKGESQFFRKITVKEAEAYTQEAGDSFYRHHTFWKDVFQDKYGVMEEPPYTVIKISLTIDNKTQLNKWVESIEDVELKNRLVNWIVENNKKDLPTIYLPNSIIGKYGILSEIKNIIDTRKIILDVCSVYYIVLETLGFIKKQNLLLCEYYQNEI